MADSPNPKPTPEQLARYAAAFNSSQTLQYFGVRVAFPDGEKVVASMDTIRPEHRGGLGTSAVNGGVLAAVFDLVIGCTSALVDPSRRTATMQLSISFERPVFGNSLRAEATINACGKSILFASACILDEAGRDCARCQGLVRLSSMPWKTGESPAIN
jgi:uncharacterized protein (TIGR00369 family)